MLLIKEEKNTQHGNQQPRPKVLKTLRQPLVWRLFLPNVILGLGAAILIPYMNVFFRGKFAMPSNTLGILFSLSSLLTGLGSILGPWLAHKLKSKIKTIVLTQGVSIGFLLLIGFAPIPWLAAIGFLLRTALMNMANPLYSAFAMERTAETERGAVNSLLNISWMLGWAVGPYISGLVQKT